MVSLLCRLRISEGRPNCSTLRAAHHRNRGLRKHDTKYKNMQKWMVEVLRKLGNHAIKSGRDNSIFITKIYQFTVIYFNFVRCWGFVVMLASLNYPLMFRPFKLYYPPIKRCNKHIHSSLPHQNH